MANNEQNLEILHTTANEKDTSEWTTCGTQWKCEYMANSDHLFCNFAYDYVNNNNH